jgi:hypothetical protein
MTRRLKDSEVSTYMMCQALAGPLVEIEETILPSLEANVREIRRVCKEAYDILGKIESRVEKLEPDE